MARPKPGADQGNTTVRDCGSTSHEQALTTDTSLMLTASDGDKRGPSDSRGQIPSFPAFCAICGGEGHQVEECPLEVSAMDPRQVPQPPEIGRPRQYDQILLRGWSPSGDYDVQAGGEAGISAIAGGEAEVPARGEVGVRASGRSGNGVNSPFLAALSLSPTPATILNEPAVLGEGGSVILVVDKAPTVEDQPSRPLTSVSNRYGIVWIVFFVC